MEENNNHKHEWFEKIIDQSGNVIASIYNDLLKNTVVTIGDVISYPFRTIRVLLKRWRDWIEKHEMRKTNDDDK